MNMKMKLFSYNSIDTPIHRLSGLTKLICFLLLTFAVMFSYDIRVILAVMVFSLAILRLSRIKFSQIRLMVILCLDLPGHQCRHLLLLFPGAGCEYLWHPTQYYPPVWHHLL